MTDDVAETPEWVWQGFFGPMSAVTELKIALDEDPRCGVWVPIQGEPPMPCDVTGALGMFAVQTRPSDPVLCPPDLWEAPDHMVGRMVAA